MKKFANKFLYVICALIMCFSFAFAGCDPNEGKAVTRIQIGKTPDKMEYYVGELFDPTGMILLVQYEDGSTARITEGYTWDVTGELEEDDDEIIVEYKGRKKILEIEVTIVVPTDLVVSKEPDKKVYYAGERFDKTGMELTATYEDGSTRTITSGFRVSPATKLKKGDTKVKITYNKKSIDYPILVTEAPLTAISIETPPNKTEYLEGEYFDFTGMVVKGTYADGTTAQISDYNYSPKTALTADVNKITITKGEFSAEQPITVSEANKALFITTNPTKVSYTAGESFDPAGMVVSYKEKGASATVLNASDYTISGGDDLQIGSVVTITLKADDTVKTTVPVMVSQEINIVNSMVTGAKYTEHHDKLSRDAVNGDYVANFVKGSTVTYTLESPSAGKAGITIRAASSWVAKYSEINEWWPTKVKDVRANTVFDVYVNGVKVNIADDVYLRGGETTDPNGDIYLLANYSYVKLENVDFVAGENTVQLVFLEQIYKNDRTDALSSPYLDTILISFGECANHKAGTAYFSNDTTHWNVCDYCRDKINVADHDFNQKVIDAKYFASEADCTKPTTYYYSCVCGEKGTTTFEEGAKGGHSYVSKTGDGLHWQECEACGDKQNQSTDHDYQSVVTEVDGVQKIEYVCLCGDKKEKSLSLTDANYVNLGASNLAGTNSIPWAAGEYAKRTSASVRNSGSTTVQQALNKSTGGDFISQLYGGSRIEVPVSVSANTTGTIVVKASSGWINNASWSTSKAKTGDMQFNLIFKAYVRHANGSTTQIEISDAVVLKGATGNYSIMANWNYVVFDGVELAQGDVFVLESLCPKTQDGKYVYWDGASAPKSVSDGSCSKGDALSSPHVDTVALYLN